MLQLSFLNDNQSSPFDRIKRIDEQGYEFWYARELMDALEYSEWRHFKSVVNKGRIACKNGGYNPDDHFVEDSRPITGGKGAKQDVKDIKLSRMGCYYTAQNGDPNKPIVAFAQTYFVTQTRKQEVSESQKQLKSQQDITAYRLAGKSELDAISRVGAKAAVKEQNNTIYGSHITHSPDFGKIGSAQNQALFDMTKAQIVEHLGLLPKDADKYRDRLGRWANEAVRIAGKEITRQIKQEGRELTDNEIIAIVVPISRNVTETARAMARLDRVDFLSGAPLDDDGNPQLPRNIRLLPKGDA